MKIKRSKFINDVRRHIADVKEAEAVASPAEQAGMEWFPEEPELPERVSVLTRAGCYLVWPTKNEARDAPEVYREAAACYNLFRRLLREYEHRGSRTWVTQLQEMIDEEREKLRTP